MTNISFFDSHCMVGMRADRREDEPWSVQHLIEDLHSYGIAEALVIHAMSRDYDPHAGNKELCRMIKGVPGLWGCWAILPPATNELPAPGTFIRQMRANNIAAVIAYPRTHNFSLADWSLGVLLSSLESNRIPLLLPFGQFEWNEVERLCAGYGSLPIIVTGLNYRQLRHLLPLWQRYRQLYVDLSWFSIHDGLAFLADRGLLRQVVFGSNYPYYDPGAAVAMVRYAALGIEQEQMVAGGTLREILRGTGTEAA